MSKTRSGYHVITAEPLFIHKTIDCIHQTLILRAWSEKSSDSISGIS